MPSGVLRGAAGAALETDGGGAWQAGPSVLDGCSGAGLAVGAALACSCVGTRKGAWTAGAGLDGAGWASAGPGPALLGLSRTTRCRECGEPSACAGSGIRAPLLLGNEQQGANGAGTRTRFRMFRKMSASFLSTRPAWMT